MNRGYREAPVGFDVELCAEAPTTDAGEDALLALEFSVHRIGDGDGGVAAIDSGKLDELLGVRQRERAEDERIEDSEDCDRSAYTNGENEDHRAGEARGSRKCAKSVDGVLTERLHSR